MPPLLTLAACFDPTHYTVLLSHLVQSQALVSLQILEGQMLFLSFSLSFSGAPGPPERPSCDLNAGLFNVEYVLLKTKCSVEI